MQGSISLFVTSETTRVKVIRRKTTSFVCINTPFWGRGGRRGSAMVPFERTMVVSYRLSIVTIVLSVTIRPPFATECLRRSNQRGWVTFQRNLEKKGLTDVSQILTRPRRDN